MKDNKDHDKMVLGACALGLLFAYMIGTGLIELAKIFVAVFSN